MNILVFFNKNQYIKIEVHLIRVHFIRSKNEFNNNLKILKSYEAIGFIRSALIVI